MNENQILLQLMDQLNLYRAGSLGQLQSPQALQLFAQKYGNPNMRDIQYVQPKGVQLGGLAKNVMRGIAPFGVASMVYEGLSAPATAAELTPEQRLYSDWAKQQYNVRYF